ncbi:MAG: hypothetical protein KC776_21165 [Myxococcales bacterium]|nr:hypothetical protein [Myxococcales bacterium]MCB9581534.1 hypothetical protein [Polyangiaceae bacterium]
MGATTRRAVACLGLSLGLPACNACDPLPEPTLSPCADAAPTIQEVADDAATPAWDDKRAERHACQFGPGSLTTESVGALPHGTELPFDHVVILMLENRSFDHFLAELPGADVRTSGVNLDSHGIPIPQAVEQQFCADGDVNHEWEKVHAQWHFGQMDGFVVTNHDSPEPMRYFTRDQLPYFYWLAETFATSERHFSSLLGPTWPNRYFLLAGTSWGRTSTPNEGNWKQIEPPPLSSLSIFDRLVDKGVSVRLYSDNSVPLTPLMLPDSAVTLWPHAVSEFEADAAAGVLPGVSFVEPMFTGDERSDDHPPADVRRGQAFIERVVKAVAEPASWPHTVLFVTYDEHGGYFDHVPPPPACPPDDELPASHAFDRLGVRVPLLAVSPWSVPGHVGQVVTDHTSITRFIENRWDLGALTRRDANAWPLLDLFDFEHPRPFPEGAPAIVPPPAPGTGCP